MTRSATRDAGASATALGADPLCSALEIGAVAVSRVVESEGPLLTPEELFPDARPEHLALNRDWLVPRHYAPAANRLTIAIQGFVLRHADRTIVVDTCVGDCKARRRPEFDRSAWGWLERLAASGVRCEEVDLVVLTHFHVDHVGWNTRLADGRWVPTFPNARYLFVREEWAFWSSERGMPGRDRTGDYLADSLLPVVEAGRVDFVATDHAIDAAIRLVPAPGHTPGHVCVGIESRGRRGILAADLMHHPLQCRYPHWSTRFCDDQARSRATRCAFLAAIADSGTLVIPAHFASPSAGYVEREADAYRFRFIAAPAT